MILPPVFVTQPTHEPLITGFDDTWCFVCDIPSSETRMYMIFPPNPEFLVDVIEKTRGLSPITLSKVNELLDKTHYTPVVPNVPSQDFEKGFRNYLSMWAKPL